MGETENSFFEGKRPWSRLKDEIIRKYLVPYLQKVNKLQESIILIDSFAGPGKFDDGEIGSPLFICELAEKYVPNNYLAILVNKDQDHHNKLEVSLADYIKRDKVMTIKGKAEELLKTLHGIITSQTLFIYLDPFGLNGTDFSLLEPYLKRSKNYSTEIIINLNIPTILRLSSLNALEEKGLTPEIQSKHKTLTKVLGGDYWKKYLLDQKLTTEKRIDLLLAEYKTRLINFLPEVGYCPVYEKTEKSNMKYCIFFASRHPDAKLLMNDIMFNAYWKYIWKRNYEDTLFGELDWSDNLPDSYYINLRDEIFKNLSHSEVARKNLWKKIVDEKFMQYHQKHFKAELKNMIIKGIIRFIDVKGTGKLNNTSLIYKIK